MSLNGSIAVIYSDIKNNHNDGYILGIQKQANLYGYRTFTFAMPQTAELYTNNEEWVYSLIDYSRYDGVIFVEHTFCTHKNLIPPIERSLNENCRCPVVVIGDSELLPNKEALKNRRSFEMVLEHLINVHGCRNIYCLGGDKNIPDDRIDGFISVMHEHGLDCDENNLLYGGYWITGAEKLANDIACGSVDKPDAVMCLSDEIAYALIKNLYSCGLRVPDDLIVTGFDNAPCASNTAVSITTIAAETEHCGREAVSTLHALINKTEPEIIKPPKLKVITGESCGCGANKKLNIRSQLDRLQKNETVNMEFRNSRFEEIYRIRTLKQLSFFVKNHKYLIRDQISVGVNLMGKDDDEALCIYLKDYFVNGESGYFRAADIYPDDFSFGAIKNVHILPLVFENEVYGFMTLGYSSENVYSRFAKVFANRIAIAVEIMNLRQETVVQEEIQETVKQDDDDISKSANYVMVLSGESMKKIPLDSVIYFEAFDRKVFAVLKNGKFEMKQRLFEVEEYLPKPQFFRISRSIILNMEKVIGYKNDIDRTLIAVLMNKEELHVSRNNCNFFKTNLIKI